MSKQKIKDVLSSDCTSFWLKDASRDAAFLAGLLRQRANEILGLSG